jgi:hypothetical protein
VSRFFRWRGEGPPGRKTNDQRLFFRCTGRLGDLDASLQQRLTAGCSGVCLNSHSGCEITLLTLRATFIIMPIRKEFSAPRLKFHSLSWKCLLCALPLSRQRLNALIVSIAHFPEGLPAARRRRNRKCSVNGVVWRVRLPTFAVGVTAPLPPRHRRRPRSLPPQLCRAHPKLLRSALLQSGLPWSRKSRRKSLRWRRE